FGDTSQKAAITHILVTTEASACVNWLIQKIINAYSRPTFENIGLILHLALHEPQLQHMHAKDRGINIVVLSCAPSSITRKTSAVFLLVEQIRVGFLKLFLIQTLQFDKRKYDLNRTQETHIPNETGPITMLK
ncbi:unnamed protein product, partial [Sphenostylis stenocarpa]